MALFSLQGVLNRQYQLQDQEQAMATRAHTAALTSVRSGSGHVLSPSQLHPASPFFPVSPGGKYEIESPEKSL